MRNNLYLTITLNFILFSSLGSAQDFRGAKWGMNKNQILKMEKETDSKFVLDGGTYLLYTVSSTNNLYSSMKLSYNFDKSKDSLKAIYCWYKDYNVKLYAIIIKIETSMNKDFMIKGTDYFWRNKDKSTITRLTTDGIDLYKIITPSSNEEVQNIEFRKRNKIDIRTPVGRTKKMRTIINFSGSSNENTDDFIIKSKKWKIIWRAEKQYPDFEGGNFSVTLVDSNGDKDLIVNIIPEDNGETIIRRPGTFYLNIFSVLTNWFIEIQEY